MFSQEHPLESTGHALTATACDLLEVTGVTVEISGAIDANISATGSASAAMPPTALQPLFMVNANVVEDKTMEPALPVSQPIHESPPVRRVIMAEDSPPHSRYSYSAALQVLAVVRSPTNELSVRGSGRREFSALLPSGECVEKIRCCNSLENVSGIINASVTYFPEDGLFLDNGPFMGPEPDSPMDTLEKVRSHRRLSH